MRFTKKRGGKDGSAEGRDGSEQQAQEQQTPQSPPPPTLLQLVGKGRRPGMQFDPEQQGKVMFHQCPLLEITPGKKNDLPCALVGANEGTEHGATVSDTPY